MTTLHCEVCASSIAYPCMQCGRNMSIPIDYLEKYREGYEYVMSLYRPCDNYLLQQDRAKRFGRWFAESDWEDTGLGWRMWTVSM